jgi:8-amino-7-oxononanoate synthase
MLIEHLNRQLREREAQSLRRRVVTAISPCAPHQRVLRAGAERSMLGFCSNDYLGLANHPALIQAMAEGAARWGAGSGASHLISGHSQAHAALEDDLAEMLASSIPGARALFFGTGYLANLALLTTLGDVHTTLYADKLNHASLIDGGLLARAQMQRYTHGRLDVLERQLRQCTTPIRFIVTDAVFSMDGDLAEMPALLALAQAYDAWIVVDDAHGFGVLGPRGRGSLAHHGLCSDRFIYMGTLGKAAGIAGAFVAAHPTIVEALLQGARGYIYTTATPPALAHALRESVWLIAGDEGERRRQCLRERIAQLREGLRGLIAQRRGLGWQLAESTTAIQPLIVGDNQAALQLAVALDEQCLWVPAIRPPTVPLGTARLRITLSAAHTHDDVERLLDALREIASR